MKTKTLLVKKYCSFSGELLCLDDSGLTCVAMGDNTSGADLLSMVGRTYEFTGTLSNDGNNLFVKAYQEVINE